MPERVTCPHCDTRNTIPEDGQRKSFRCRECRRLLRGSQEVAPAEEADERRRSRRADPPELARPRRGREGPPGQGGSAGLLIVGGLCVFGVVVFGGALVLAWMMLPARPAPVPAPAPNNAFANDGFPPPPPPPRRNVDSPPPPPGRPAALDDEPGMSITQYNDEYVIPPDVTTTLPQWFHERDVELPAGLKAQLRPNTHQGVLAPDSPLWAELEKKVRTRQFRKSGLVKGRSGKIYVEDYSAKGGLLIGFFIEKNGFAPYLQPIYLTRDGEEVGRAYGRPTANAICWKAKAGYAVGGMYVHSGDLMNGLALTYQKVTQTGLDRNDWYKSEWVGKDGGASGVMGHDGAFVVGVHSKLLASDYFSPRGAVTTLGTISLK